MKIGQLMLAPMPNLARGVTRPLTGLPARAHLLVMRLLAPLIALMLGTSIDAHPHVFVDVRGDFVLDDGGRLEAIRIHWLYDSFTTLMAMQNLGLDPDRDGRLDEADLRVRTH